MSNVFKKLGFSNEKRILVLNAPRPFEEHLMEMLNTTIIDRIPLPDYDYDFILAFAHQAYQPATYMQYVENLDNEHHHFWIAYQDDKADIIEAELNVSNPNYTQKISVLPNWKALLVKSKNQSFTPTTSHTASSKA